MTDRLGVTPTRLRYLADAERGQLPSMLTRAEAELLEAGWIEPAETIGVWRPTAYGRAIAAVRVLEREDGKHIVAEVGDPDEPRILGDVIRPGKRWLVKVGPRFAACDTKHQAREELRHMAATLLAAEEVGHA